MHAESVGVEKLAHSLLVRQRVTDADAGPGPHILNGALTPGGDGLELQNVAHQAAHLHPLTPAGRGPLGDFTLLN